MLISYVHGSVLTYAGGGARSLNFGLSLHLHPYFV